MPKGIAKSGKRRSSPRTPGVVITCEHCAGERRFMASEVRVRGEIKFCSWACVVASRQAGKADAKLRRKAANVLRRRALAGGASRQDVAQIITAAEGRCTYCGIPTDRLEVDHFEPAAAGGTNDPDNLLPCCRFCNASKAHRDPIEWLHAKHGVEGLARALAMVEQRKLVEALYPVVIAEYPPHARRRRRAARVRPPP